MRSHRESYTKKHQPMVVTTSPSCSMPMTRLYWNLSDELQQILTIYDKTLLDYRFGLQMTYDETETMVFNTDTALMVQKSIIFLSKEKIKNVRNLKYLGYTITNSDNMSFLRARISSTFQKCNILTTCVRSCLLYSIQTWRLSECEIRHLAWFSQSDGARGI